MKLPSLLSKDTSSAGSVVDWVPAHLFFIKRLELPEELDEAEVESFAELTLEDIAPFPIEQLNWGHYSEKENGNLYVFAACKPRIPSQQLQSWPDKTYVFSSFTLFLGEKIEQPCILGLWQDKVVTAFYFDGTSVFPQSWAHHLIVEPEAPEEGEEPSPEYAAFDLAKEAFAGYAQLSQALAGKFKVPVESGLIQIEKSRVGNDDTVTTYLTKQADPEAEPEDYKKITVSDMDAIWSADLRDADYIEQAKKERATEQKLWMGLIAAGIAALLIVLLNIGNLVGTVFASYQDKKIATQLPDTIQILDNEQYLEDLQQFTGKEFQPFNVLQALNDFRPDDIYFNYSSANSNNQIRIKGIAQSVPELNRYSGSLRDSKFFSEVTQDNVRPIRGGGGVSFTLKLTYLPQLNEVSEEVAQN